MSIGEVITGGIGEVGTVDSSSPSTNHVNGQSAEVIDINDPRLTSEQLTENPDGDSFAVPPPPPDGKWRAKLKQVDIKDSSGNLQRFAAFCYPKMNNGKPFLATNVESTVLESSGKYDGTKLTEYWVKTAIDRSGNSQVGTIMAKLKQPLAPATPGQRMEQFLRVLAAEPEIVIETAWEASCMACQETAKKKGERAPKPFLFGMHRFPQLRIGGHDPVVFCPQCKGQCRAQARIVSYWGLETPHNK